MTIAVKESANNQTAMRLRNSRAKAAASAATSATSVRTRRPWLQASALRIDDSACRGTEFGTAMRSLTREHGAQSRHGSALPRIAVELSACVERNAHVSAAGRTVPTDPTEVSTKHDGYRRRSARICCPRSQARALSAGDFATARRVRHRAHRRPDDGESILRSHARLARRRRRTATRAAFRR